MRILWIELRRSIAVWTALALLVVAFGCLYALPGPWWSGGEAWNRQWAPSALWLRYLVVFFWPIVVGAGALQGLRDSRSGTGELLATTSRPGWHRAVKLAIAFALMLALGYLVLFAAGAAQVIVHGGFFDFAWLPVVVVGILGLVAGAWLGLGVGRTLPHPLTPPAVAVVALAGGAYLQAALSRGFTPGGVLPNRLALLQPSLDEPWNVLLITAARVHIGQAGWFAGLAGTGLLLLAAGSVRARLYALLPLVAGLAVALPLFPATRDGDYVIDQQAARLVCDGDVCVTAMHEGELARVTGPAREALRLLAKLTNAPVKVEDTIASPLWADIPRRSPSVVYLNLGLEEIRNASADGLVTSMVAGAGVPPCAGENSVSPHEIVARTVTAAWFTGEVKLPPEFGWLDQRLGGPVNLDGEINTAWAALRALPAEQQAARVDAVRQAGMTCQKDLLDVLMGVAR